MVAIAGHSTATSKVSFLHFGGKRGPVVRRNLLPAAGKRGGRKKAAPASQTSSPAASAGSGPSKGPEAASASESLNWSPMATAEEFAVLEANREQRRQDLKPNCKVCRAGSRLSMRCPERSHAALLPSCV